MKCKRVIAGAMAVAWLVACASPSSVQPIPELGSAYALEKDELKLWNQSRDEERKLRQKLELLEDPLLQDYVDSLGQGLVEPATRASGQLNFSFHVVEDPTINAFAFPHGSIYIHSGLIARTESEAQLAMTLGHEISHVEQRHALKHRRSARNKAIGIGIAAAAASIIVAREAGRKAEQGDFSSAAVISRTADIILGVGLQLAYIAAVQGYGRRLEREADEAGMAKLVSAGYDPREAPRLFAVLLQEHPDAGKVERFFFASHPANEERRRTAEELLQTRYSVEAGSGTISSRDYELRRRLVVRHDARLNIEAGRLNLAEIQIDQVLEATPRDPVALTLRGKLHKRLAANAATPEQKRSEQEVALEAYLEAIDADPALAEPRREVGLLLMQTGRREEAGEHLRRYLDLAPGATDVQIIRDYLRELDAA